MSAFAQDRANEQQDLDFDYKEWQTEKMFPFMKLGFGSNLIGSLPLEQKQAVPQPAEDCPRGDRALPVYDQGDGGGPGWEEARRQDGAHA